MGAHAVTLPTYPTSLPTPGAFSITPASRRLSSGGEAPPLTMRRIETPWRADAQARWVLNPAQWHVWQSFWDIDLLQGTSWFSAPLWPMPYGSGVDVRFVSAVQTVPQGRGIVTMNATLHLRRS